MPAAVGSVSQRWGGIDVLVASAVHWGAESLPDPARRFEDVPAAEWQQMIRANLEGTVATVQAVLPVMRGRADARIVLVSSDVARMRDPRYPGLGIYAAAKAALSGLACGLVAELRGEVLVNIVCPGLTLTERNLARMPAQRRAERAVGIPTGRLSAPEDVADVILFLGSPANRNITGETLNVTGGA
jgi:NAD(P)-dependent dehydrogenase (short-subunit alcohol dehydrogenase family)